MDKSYTIQQSKFLKFEGLHYLIIYVHVLRVDKFSTQRDLSKLDMKLIYLCLLMKLKILMENKNELLSSPV